ncbi:MAG: metallophosphoesterase [Candidatus Azobacteroides sp.]|nr:metallophosphoesterase [Candidatus Azobacteroides sp.]
MSLFFFLVFLLYTLINFYIFRRGRTALTSVRKTYFIYCLLFFIFYSAFVIAMLGRNYLPLGLQKVLYFIGTCWMGVLFYITLYFLITDCLYVLNRFFRFLPRKITPLLFRRIQVVSGYLIVIIALTVGYIRFNHPVVVEKDITIHKPGGHYKELKAVVVSDLHLGVQVDKKKLQKYVQLINSQQPDIILIAGDIVDNNVLPLNEERMYEEFNQLNAPLGVYFCMGNHEYLSGIEASRKFLEKTNITLLVDTAIQVNHSFWIIGRNDQQGGFRKPLHELVAQTDTLQALILLDHEPYFLDDAVNRGIDLQISGHTHDGQLWPLNLMVEKMFELAHGYKQKGKTHFYVSSGLALWGPPFRIGTQSELVVLHIHLE